MEDFKSDFKHQIEADTLLPLGSAFIVSGISANTGIDRSIAKNWQTKRRNKTTNQFFKAPEYIGGLTWQLLLGYAGAMGAGYLSANHTEQNTLGSVVYHWGYRSFRTLLFGGVQQFAFARILGSGRPCRSNDSKWQPFRYENGVSGHAFYGGIPFITAGMMSDPPLLKYGLYAISTLPGLSRINSHAHYFSQVLLGWSVAFLSARSVYQSDLDQDHRKSTWQFGLYPHHQGMMLQANLSF
jgi:membrane-associated phospholipid phosphatase